MSDMQRIPVHTGEKQAFTPVSLKHLEAPPSFTLRAPSRRQREELQYALHEAGLRRHDDEAIREATIEELCRLWECDETDENVIRLRTFWSAIDDYNDSVENYLIEVSAAKDAEEEPPIPLPDFEHPDQEPVDELIARLARSSPRLRRLATENVKFSKEFPRFAIAHAVRKWSNLNTRPRFEEGVMQIETICEMQQELTDRFKEDGEAAFVELAAASVGRYFLTKAAEKNSSSGPVSQQTPLDTKETGSASANGKSPASASSEKTPAA